MITREGLWLQEKIYDYNGRFVITWRSFVVTRERFVITRVRFVEAKIGDCNRRLVITTEGL